MGSRLSKIEIGLALVLQLAPTKIRTDNTMISRDQGSILGRWAAVFRTAAKSGRDEGRVS